MAERKRFSGDEASLKLLGLGRNILAALRRDMTVNKLTVGKRVVDVAPGVRIAVSSVFGQDEITIHVPPERAAPLVEEAAQFAQTDPEFKQIDGKQGDLVTVGSSVTLTVTVYENVVINPGDGTAGSGGTREVVGVASSVKLTIVTTTPAPPYTPPVAPPQIIIGGYTNKNGIYKPFIWDDVNGLRMLGLRSTYMNEESTGVVNAMSADGSILVGYVTVRDPTMAGAAEVGPQMRACAWRNGTADSDVVWWERGKKGFQSQARTIDAGGTVRGMWFERNVAFQWNGRGGDKATDIGGTVNMGSTSSPNGRVKVTGSVYQLDGGPMIKIGNDVVANCVTHIPYTAPTPPSTTPTVTTTVLVFSG